jgi:hypothetical protein
MKHIRIFVFFITMCLLGIHAAVGFSLQHENNFYRTSAHEPEPLLPDERMLQVGEELDYSVHYSFFNIGKIHFQVTGKEERNGKTFYKASAIMDSNPSLSWLVELHIRFYSEMDQDAVTYKWLSEDSSGKGTTYRKMNFDYEKNKMYYEWGEKLRTGDYKKTGDRIIPISNYCEDGLSLFFYAREHARGKKQEKIPTFVDTNEVTTIINFGIERGEEEIDAVKYPIDVQKLEGRADFVGVFGLTGGFEGVFTNDVAGIPITARMKVILGSVKVELMSWKRSSWIPPKAASEK